MNNRERFMAVMNYQDYDRLPVIHFGYWQELLDKWADEKHITRDEARSWSDGNDVCKKIGKELGFDFGFQILMGANNSLLPPFEYKVLKTLPDGSSHALTAEGVVVLEIPGTLSIHAEIEHTLTDRASWEKHYLPKLQWTPERLGKDLAKQIDFWNNVTDYPAKLHVGSLIGTIRNILGVIGLSYMQIDDPDLLDEIIKTFADIIYRNTEEILKAGYRPDSAHFWEDICFNHGPLVSPEFFRDKIVPHYQRITSLIRSYNCDIISVDCDGLIEELIPHWIAGGCNTMFPIEIGTWHPDFAAWRKQYGPNLRGIGAMNKHVLSMDKSAVNQEIERLKPLVALGGYLPCPDHRLPPETKWELVQYYTDQMHKTFA